MRSPPKEFSRRAFPLLLPLGVLAVGLLVTAVVTMALAREAQVQDAARFNRLVDESKQLLETRVERYEVGLAGLQEFFSARESVSTPEWEVRLSLFEAKINYPGLIGLGYAHWLDEAWGKVPPDRAMEAAATRVGVDRPAKWRVLFSYHADGWPEFTYGENLMDRCIEDLRNDTVPRAYKSGSPTLSPKRIVENGISRERASTFTFYFPVYDKQLSSKLEILRSGSQGDRGHARQLHCRALVFASFDVNRLLDSIFGKAPQPVEFELFSSAKPAPEQWLNDRNRVMRFGDRNHQPYLSRLDIVPCYGTKWCVYFYTTPLFLAESSRYRAWLAASVGIPLSILFAGVTWTQARGRAKAEQSADSLRRSEGRLQVALKEREQISCDLHDGTIQSLYAIGLGLGQLRRALGGAKEQERMDASLEELDHVVAELRSYLVTLDPGVSPAQSAAAALSELVSRLRQTAATDLRFTAEDGIGNGWPPAAVLDLLQAAREGVSNALRHGQATQVDLSLRGSGNGAVLFIIEDNGKGFDPSTARRKDGHGLANLERRAQAWNGSLHVESRAGGQTRLTLTVFPLGGKATSSR